MTFVSDDIDNAFHSKLEECENRQRELQSIRLALEKEISVKKTSISIDRDRCLRYDVNPCLLNLKLSMRTFSGRELASPPPTI